MSTILNDDTNSARKDHVGTANKNLKFLANLEDYQVHHDDVDPRGYSVQLASGEHIGEVEGLLADLHSMTVRYVEVELKDDVISRHTHNRYKEEDKHALIPVGLVHIDSDHNSITILGVEMDQIVDYPRFQKQRGYTTAYEIDTNDYLSDFHDFGSKYDRKRYSTDVFRNADVLDEGFYSTGLYSSQYR